MQKLIYGISPVEEALKSRRRVILKLLLADGARAARIEAIESLARKAGVRLERREKRHLDQLTKNATHQGVVALISQDPLNQYVDAEDILASLSNPPLVVLLDGVEDPHNLGAILRTCECAGVDGVFLPEHRSAPINETVAKTSAGAVEYVKVARVTNLVPLIEELKSQGFWVVGVEAGASTVYTGFDLTVPLALVLGSEGKGLRRLVRERVDVIVSIEMKGKVNSLNVSVAAGIVIFEALRQRGQASTAR
jgi:23S rRNA (guanosine2251-2'-O)-methyltransferase